MYTVIYRDMSKHENFIISQSVKTLDNRRSGCCWNVLTQWLGLYCDACWRHWRVSVCVLRTWRCFPAVLQWWVSCSEYLANVTVSWGSMFRVPVSASSSSAGATRGAAIGVGVEFTGKQRENRSLTYDRENKYRNSVIVTTQDMRDTNWSLWDSCRAYWLLVNVKQRVDIKLLSRCD